MRKIGFWSEKEQYKEQKNETTQFKAEKTEAKESVVRVYSVSYTHLDVYKRQVLCRVLPKDRCAQK